MILWVLLFLLWHSKIPKRFSAGMKTSNSQFFDDFVPQRKILARNLIFFTFAALSYFNWTAGLYVRASLESYSHIRKYSSADLKTAKNPLPLTFFGLKRNFIFYKIASFLFQHFLPPLRQQVCEIDRPWCDTVKFRNVQMRTWKPQRTHFFEFFGPKGIFSA